MKTNKNNKKMAPFFFFFSSLVSIFSFASSTTMVPESAQFTLDSVREVLFRLEDTIIFSLIERVKFPINSQLNNYNNGYGGPSLFEFIIKKTEAIQAKAGRYVNQEEIPLFPDHLPPSLVPHHNFTKILYPTSASININKNISEMYLKKLLPLFVAAGDDGIYAKTASSDLDCLQALSRRIHYGLFVDEVKLRYAPNDYGPLIHTKDRDGLMKLLSFSGQEVTAGSDNKGQGKYKVDPSVVSQLYVNLGIPTHQGSRSRIPSPTPQLIRSLY